MAHLPPFAFSPFVNPFPPATHSKHDSTLSHSDPALSSNGQNGSNTPPEIPESSTLFIGNIHKDVHRNDLQRLFSLYDNFFLFDFGFNSEVRVPGLKEFRMNFNNKEHPIAFAE